jgi:hypothetical protein
MLLVETLSLKQWFGSKQIIRQEKPTWHCEWMPGLKGQNEMLSTAKQNSIKKEIIIFL